MIIFAYLNSSITLIWDMFFKIEKMSKGDPGPGPWFNLWVNLGQLGQLFNRSNFWVNHNKKRQEKVETISFES